MYYFAYCLLILGVLSEINPNQISENMAGGAGLIVLSAFIAVTKALDSSRFDVQSTWDGYFAKAVDLAPVQYPVKNYATDTTAEELCRCPSMSICLASFPQSDFD